MAKKLDNIHQILKVVALVIVIAAATISAIKNFAKAATVDKLDHRLGLSISQDEIDRRKSDVRWMKQQVVFERRDEPPTVAEAEIIEEAERDLKETNAKHMNRVKAYEDKYEQAF